MKSTSEIRAAWLAQLHSTAPTDRPRAEAAVRALYAAARFPEPRHFFWFESPCAAAWPVTVLVAEGDRALTPLLALPCMPAVAEHRVNMLLLELLGDKEPRRTIEDWVRPDEKSELRVYPQKESRVEP